MSITNTARGYRITNPNIQQSRATKKYYDKNKEKIYAQQGKWRKNNREKIRKAAKERRGILTQALRWYKEEHGCVECGITDYRMLEFDHLPEYGKKVREVGRIAALPSMWNEIQKCEVVCANHHSLRSHNRRQQY